MTPSERATLIAGLRHVPERIEAAVQGLAEKQLDERGGEGWSIRQVVHHLADADMNLFVRIKLTLTEDRPTLKPFDQERWADLPDAASHPIQPSLLILKGLCQRVAALLESAPDRSWSRRAFHPEVGEMTLEELLRRLADHGENHLRQIAKIKAAARQ